jgi:hypothetical protein
MLKEAACPTVHAASLDELPEESTGRGWPVNLPICLLDLVLSSRGADIQLVVELCLLDHLGRFFDVLTKLRSGSLLLLFKVRVCLE